MVVDDIRYKYGMINKPSQEKRLKASHLEKNNIPEEIVKLIEEKEPLSINGTLGSKKGAMPIESENEVARFKKLVVQNREILEKISIYKLPAIPLGDSECQNRLNNNYQF